MIFASALARPRDSCLGLGLVILALARPRDSCLGSASWFLPWLGLVINYWVELSLAVCIEHHRCRQSSTIELSCRWRCVLNTADADKAQLLSWVVADCLYWTPPMPTKLNYWVELSLAVCIEFATSRRVELRWQISSESWICWSRPWNLV